MQKKAVFSEAKNQRPISPHLQVYSPQITSVLSILHRILGVALSFGAVLLVYWLVAAAFGPDTYLQAQIFFASWFGQLILFGMSFSLFYHFANGIRHLLWDAGIGFDMPTLRATGVLVIISSFGLTAITWIVAYIRAGIL